MTIQNIGGVAAECGGGAFSGATGGGSAGRVLAEVSASAGSAAIKTKSTAA